MYKMILVDDDEFIIKSMIKHIDWSKLDIEIIATASTGVKGLQKIFELNPDIVVADIDMPDMTGLEMVSEINKSEFSPKIVLLTGYDDFSFAQKAISLGVCEYVTKPVMPNDIISIMQGVVNQCKVKNLEETKIQEAKDLVNDSMPIFLEKFIEELTNGFIVDDDEFQKRCNFLSIDLNNMNYWTFIVNINNYNDFNKNHDELQKCIIKQTIISIISSNIENDKIHCYNINFKDKQTAFLIAQPKTITERISIPNMEEIIKNYKMKYNVLLSIGVGSLVSDYKKIKLSYTQATECLKFLFSQNSGKILFYEDIVNTQIINPSELYDRNGLIDSLKMRNIPAVETIIMDMIENIKSQKNLNSEYIKTITQEMLSVISYTIYNIGECSAKEMAKNNIEWKTISNSQHISDIVSALYEILEYVKSTLGIKTSQRSSRIIAQIIKYIEDNYT
ncbi:MAG: response regulator, partial [Oscillospiraceae bacterium]